MIGAGKMGQLAATSFLDRGAERVFVANHRIERAEALAARFGGEAVSFDHIVEELERAVDLRDVDRGRVLPHLGEDVIRGAVTQLLHRREDQLALGRQAITLRPQLLLPVGGHPSSLGAPVA